MAYPQYGPPGGQPRPWAPNPGGPYPQQPGYPYGYATPRPQGGPGYGPPGPPPGYQAQPAPPQQPPPPPRRKPSRVWLAIPAVLLVAAAALIVVGLVAPGMFVRTVYNAEAVQLGVQQILRGSYKLGAVESVTCPDGMPVEPDRTFQCRVRVGDRDQTVQVRVRNAEGLYEVGYPR